MIHLGEFFKILYSETIRLFSESMNGLTYNETFYLLICLVIVLVLYNASKKFYSLQLLLIIVSLALSTIYVVWRVRYTLVLFPVIGAATSLLLFGAEFLGYFQQVIFYFLMSRGTNIKKVYKNGLDFCPTVDIFVATYNEPLHILKRTLTACTNLDYPAKQLKIYVCDDGDRQEVEQLAKYLGILYIRRDDPSHAKAGNLNHAMKCSNGDLILTLDADMVPKSNFLKRTVGYFQKRRVGFVQVPQLFFNPDPFQHNLSSSHQIANEQDFFMVEMQAAKSKYNATMYVGSNCIFSRAALKSIGGFATGSITEDVATGMLLQAKGYRTYFVKEALARGLAPESFSEMLHQRDRWCRGNFQATRKWNPIFYPGLTFSQRLLYFSGVLYWYFGVQKMIYLIAPILFLDFGIKIMNAPIFMILLFWFPQFQSSMLTFKSIAKGRRTSLWSHIYETAMAPTLALSAIKETLFIKKSVFRVTKKGVESNKIQVVWQSFIPFTVLLISTIYGFYLQANWILNGKLLPTFYWFNDFWSFYNLISIILSIYICIEPPRPRRYERFNISVPIVLNIDRHTYRGVSMDISENGARIQLTENVHGIPNELELHIEGIDGVVPVKLVKTSFSVMFEIRVTWGDLPLSQYKQLVKLLFDQKEDIENEFLHGTKNGFVSTLVRATKSRVKSPKRTSRQNSYGHNGIVLSPEEQHVAASQNVISI